eukprot:c22264_g1_i5 orf=416-640(-)
MTKRLCLCIIQLEEENSSMAASYPIIHQNKPNARKFYQHAFYVLSHKKHADFFRDCRQEKMMNNFLSLQTISPN